MDDRLDTLETQSYALEIQVDHLSRRIDDLEVKVSSVRSHRRHSKEILEQTLSSLVSELQQSLPRLEDLRKEGQQQPRTKSRCAAVWDVAAADAGHRSELIGSRQSLEEANIHNKDGLDICLDSSLRKLKNSDFSNLFNFEYGETHDLLPSNAGNGNLNSIANILEPGTTGSSYQPKELETASTLPKRKKRQKRKAANVTDLQDGKCKEVLVSAKAETVNVESTSNPDVQRSCMSEMMQGENVQTLSETEIVLETVNSNVNYTLPDQTVSELSKQDVAVSSSGSACDASIKCQNPMAARRNQTNLEGLTAANSMKFNLYEVLDVDCDDGVGLELDHLADIVKHTSNGIPDMEVKRGEKQVWQQVLLDLVKEAGQRMAISICRVQALHAVLSEFKTDVSGQVDPKLLASRINESLKRNEKTNRSEFINLLKDLFHQLFITNIKSANFIGTKLKAIENTKKLSMPSLRLFLITFVLKAHRLSLLSIQCLRDHYLNPLLGSDKSDNVLWLCHLLRLAAIKIRKDLDDTLDQNQSQCLHSWWNSLLNTLLIKSTAQEYPASTRNDIKRTLYSLSTFGCIQDFTRLASSELYFGLASEVESVGTSNGKPDQNDLKIHIKDKPTKQSVSEHQAGQVSSGYAWRTRSEKQCPSVQDLLPVVQQFAEAYYERNPKTIESTIDYLLDYFRPLEHKHRHNFVTAIFRYALNLPRTKYPNQLGLLIALMIQHSIISANQVLVSYRDGALSELSKMQWKSPELSLGVQNSSIILVKSLARNTDSFSWLVFIERSLESSAFRIWEFISESLLRIAKEKYGETCFQAKLENTEQHDIGTVGCNLLQKFKLPKA